MTADFSIDVDPARDLIAIRMSGFYRTPDVDRFLAVLTLAQGRLRRPPARLVTLTDLTGMGVQSQDMVARFGAMLAEPGRRSHRLAFVVSRTLARTQLLRALNGREARCFEVRAEAEAWLFATGAC